MRSTVPAVLLAIALLTSCTIEDEAYTASQVAVIERPDITFTDAEHTFSRQGSQPIRMHTAELSYWMDDERMEAQGLSFSQMDEDGSIIMEGRADSAVIDTAVEVMDLSGDVEMRYVSRDLSIATSHLIFDTRAMTVECDTNVVVTFDDGTISGERLSGDLRSMKLDIATAAQGVVGF